MIVYIPWTGRVHVRAGNRKLRHTIAERFIETALDQTYSSQPVDFQAYDISQFLKGFDLEPPEFDDVVIDRAKVIRADISIGNLANRLSLSTTIDQDISEIIDSQPGLPKIFERAVAIRFVEIAARYRRAGRDEAQTLDFTLTDRNTSSLLSLDDPFERVLGHRLLRHWKILRDGRSPSDAESMAVMPALLTIWDIEADKVTGVWLLHRGVDSGLLTELGFLVPAGWEDDDLIDDEDEVGPIAAEVVARVIRASTSAGLYNQETDERFPATGGMHLYLLVQDGEDIPRFLRDLQARAWLAGFGWIMVAGRGALLTRSIVDITVGSPERLVFEGPPQVVAPLAQDEAERTPVAHDGELVDTRAACPPLTGEEQARVDAMVKAAKFEAKPEVEKGREAAAVELAAKVSIEIEQARATIRASINGEATSWDQLEFDDPAIGVVSVADILDDPDRYHGETLADPVEGQDYGRGKAKVFANGGGNVIVNSYAHGGCLYRLGHIADYITAKVEEAGDKAPEVLARLLVFGHGINSADEDRLRTLAAKVSKVGKAAIRDLIKEHATRARHECWSRAQGLDGRSATTTATRHRDRAPAAARVGALHLTLWPNTRQQLPKSTSGISWWISGASPRLPPTRET